jgi:hypothetical protein
MDPYLEQYWRDVHHSLCTYARDQLQPQLGPALRARIEERLVVESEIGDQRAIYPDVKIVERRPREPMGQQTATALLEPVVFEIESEPATEGYIQIIDTTTGGRLVTVIEFLSTTNKLPGLGQQAYRQKRDELWGAGVSLVEIDLLRTGDWPLQLSEHRVPRAQRTPYRVGIHRGWDGLRYEYYPLPLDRPLPAIRIPLRQSDPDARLDLQPLIDQTYQNGGYDDIDYAQPARPPLEGEHAAWADDLLRRAGKR